MVDQLAGVFRGAKRIELIKLCPITNFKKNLGHRFFCPGELGQSWKFGTKNVRIQNKNRSNNRCRLLTCQKTGGVARDLLAQVVFRTGAELFLLSRCRPWITSWWLGTRRCLRRRRCRTGQLCWSPDKIIVSPKTVELE